LQSPSRRRYRQDDVGDGGGAFLRDEEFRLTLGTRACSLPEAGKQPFLHQRIFNERRISAQRKSNIRGTSGVHRRQCWQIACFARSDEHGGRSVPALDLHVDLVERGGSESEPLVKLFANL